jgi:hypothetical protein
MMDSGEMSSQAVLQVVFVCFLLALVDISQIAAIPHTGDIVSLYMVVNCYIRNL